MFTMSADHHDIRSQVQVP